MGKEISIGYGDTSISLSLDPFLLCCELCFMEFKLFLELYASYWTLVGNLMVNPLTCELALGDAHTFKCSSLCAYLEKEFLVIVARIKLSYHDLELLYDNIFFDLIVANVLSSCASIWSKIHIFLGFFVRSGYVERVSWYSFSLCDVFNAKARKIKEHYDGLVQGKMTIIEEAMKIEPMEQDRNANIEVLGKKGPTVDGRPCTYHPRLIVDVVEEDQVLLKGRSLGDGYEDPWVMAMKI
ncbi:hypothetical protein M9H77_22682 [Catharanthus roseus]|uniref:Uncharacterized protein n=1 Tax=Catharanthus roseus TaxID=4058 RepID=A0ACC0ATB2_CATRO|nr:hypothetical protein M9H77_22682 [Catharanthus roseus]